MTKLSKCSALISFSKFHVLHGVDRFARRRGAQLNQRSYAEENRYLWTYSVQFSRAGAHQTEYLARKVGGRGGRSSSNNGCAHFVKSIGFLFAQSNSQVSLLVDTVKVPATWEKTVDKIGLSIL